MTVTVDTDLYRRVLQARLRRQNRLIDVLETEIERLRTEAEAEVILEILDRARERLDDLGRQAGRARVERRTKRTGVDGPFPRAPQPMLSGRFVQELSA
jgi:hypothetical protein